MKTKTITTHDKFYMHKKTSFTKRYFVSLLSFVVLINSCKKDINKATSTGDSSFVQNNVSSKSYNATVATDWYKLQLRFLLEKNSALSFGGHFGYIGIGLYEAVRNSKPDALSFSRKLYQMPQMPQIEQGKQYNWQISANAAMASLTRHFFIGISKADSLSIDSLEEAYNKKAPYPNSQEFLRSQSFGRNIASAIYNWYLTDNINLSNTGYVPPVFKGAWVPTPPGFANPPVLPYIGKSRTFLAGDLNETAPQYPAYSEDKNSTYFKIAKEIYVVSKNLTNEQKNIALFWLDQGDGVGYTPAGHDMSIITQAIEQTHVQLLKAAETYAKAGIAERDGAVVCFRSKYKYTRMRPVTYIQKVIDANWQPFIITPPHPEYPAAHSLVTGSVMQAASGVLGYNVEFTDHTYDFRGWAPRTYQSLFAAAEEAGISRLYGGIHYHLSIDVGLAMARIVGTRVSSVNLMKQ